MTMKNEQTFEQALQRLEEIVQKLEAGQLSLEESVSLYEQGMRLSLACDQKLKEAEQKIEMVTQTLPELRIESFSMKDEKRDGK